MKYTSIPKFLRTKKQKKKSEEKQDFEVYLEFIKHEVPSFEKSLRNAGYFFCIKLLCTSCTIWKSCTRYNGKERVPIITNEDYESIMKEHPEYRI